MVKLKKLLGGSSYTLKANIWTQFSGVIIMLTIPNMLSVDDYAKVVYFSFLLSFSSLYNFGLVAVYNRLIPGLVVSDMKEVQEIESTLIRYLVFMSIVFATVISFIYYYKYKSLVESGLIFVYLPISLIVGFFIVRDIAREDYQPYYHNIRFQSIIKLIQVPLVYLFSIVGWFISSLITQISLLVRIFKRDIFKSNYNFSFIKENFQEGIELSVKTFVWLQVLNFPRTYASLNYSDELIAQYGLVNSMYQVVVSLSLAIFVPVTVKTFKLFSKSDRLAFFYLKKVLKNTVPLFLVGSILLILIVPEVITIIFPKYNIPFEMVVGYFGTVALFPVFFVVGIIFTGIKKNNQNILISSFLLIIIYFLCITNYLNLDYAYFILVMLITILSYIYLLRRKKYENRISRKRL